MKTLDEVAKLLKDRRLDRVAESTGLSKPTIIAVRDGTATKPSFDTVQRLSKYFEDQEQPAEQAGE